MIFGRRKDGADTFFISFFTGSAAAVLLWLERWINLPTFMRGLAAGMILASAVLIFLNRKRDEFTLSAWHRGAAAGFSVSVAWLIVGIFVHGVSTNPVTRALSTPANDASLAGLVAFTSFIFAIGWMRLKERL